MATEAAALAGGVACMACQDHIQVVLHVHALPAQLNAPPIYRRCVRLHSGSKACLGTGFQAFRGLCSSLLLGCAVCKGAVWPKTPPDTLLETILIPQESFLGLLECGRLL